jgi:hypothetical protein
MDPERPKNQISRNQTKPMPLRGARCVNSDHIFFSKNGHCMQKLLRSEDQVKHSKKLKSKSTGQRQWMTSA